MWRPKTWREIEALLGRVEESSNLDFKRALTDDNPETAKDIAAMTLNGGVVLYGVDENKKTRTASELTPVPLAGVEEKLRSIAGTRISPVPDFDVEFVKDHDNAQVGIAVVVIPPSPLAPHQWNDKYPVRRGTKTEYLSEPEIERLYRQRQALSEPPPSVQDLLGEFREIPNLPSGRGRIGSFQLVIRPASSEVMHPAGAWQQKALQAAARAAAHRQAGRLANSSKVRETWDDIATWRPFEAEGWLTSRALRPISNTVEKQVTAMFTYPARLSLQGRYGIGIEVEGRPSYTVAREDDLAYDLLAVLAFAGEYFSGMDGGGQLLAAIRLAGYDGAESQFASQGGWQGARPLPGAPAGVMTQVRTGAVAMRDEPEVIARALIDAWLPAFFRDPQPDPHGPRDLFEVLVPQAQA